MTGPKLLHCKYGHAMTAANTYVRGNGRHECKKCRTQRNTSTYTGLHARGRNEVIERGVLLYMTCWGPYVLVVDDGLFPRLIFNTRDRWMPCGLCLGWVLLGHGKPVCSSCGR